MLTLDKINHENKNHGAYGELLFDIRWKTRRKQIIARDGERCVNCGSNKNLQVHHRQYHFIRLLNTFKKPWEYNDNLLITLCEKCHSKGHNKYKIPTKYI